MESAAAPNLPVLLDVASRRVVIVGGGDEASRLASSLLAYGAEVIVVAIAASIALYELAASGRVGLLSREYVRGDLAGAVLAACFEGGEVAQAVAAEAGAERCLAFISGHPELSNVDFPNGPIHTAHNKERT